VLFLMSVRQAFEDGAHDPGGGNDGAGRDADYRAGGE
jgi:hypothetical protein